MQFDDKNSPKMPRKPEGGPPRSARLSLIVFVGLLAASIALFMFDGKTVAPAIPYSTFMTHLEEGNVDSVRIIDERMIQGTLKGKAGTSQDFSTLIPYVDTNLLAELKARDVRIEGANAELTPLRVLAELFPWISDARQQ